MENQNTTEQAIDRLTGVLEKILLAVDKPKLGFTDDTGLQYVYCNRQHGCLWYTLNENREPVPILSTALTGYLQELKFEKVERRGKETYKLFTTIEADKTYILESGFDSHFSKGLLTAIAFISPHILHTPITIQPSPGEDGSVLFCRVWSKGESVKAKYDEHTDFREIAKMALSVVRAART